MADIVLLRVTTAVILLALFIQCAKGFESLKVITVSESDVDDGFSGSGSFVNENLCCIYGNCSCRSLYNALANVTSNVLINITTDVMLSLIIPLIDLANITITGHNNPTMNCNDTAGGLCLMSCYNCTIEGITWEGCGARNKINNENVYPVLHLYNSSNITIRNCSFQYSIGQAVVLSGMSGDVNINQCNFSTNKKYEGHGAAIHYSSNDTLTSSSFKFMITSCNFLYNGRAKSIVYFGRSFPKLCETLSLQNTKFHYNEGVPIYISNQNLYVNGNVEFCGNVAENGGGIFITDHSNVVFHKNATVKFMNNVASSNDGGAIFLTNHSSILFKDHPTLLYECNDNELYPTADNQFLNESFITITFYNNTANSLGQHIYAANNSNLTFGNAANITFDYLINSASSAFYADHCIVTFGGDCKVTFSNNLANGNGGGIFIISSIMTFDGNSQVTFFENKANSNGGAMYIKYSIITFKGNSTVMFNRNLADNDGGAIYIDYNSSVTFEGNSTVTFCSGLARSDGGAVYINNDASMTFEGNSTVTFNDPRALSNGGAIYILYSATITFVGNSIVTFNNVQALNGVAIYINRYSTITFDGNCRVLFNNSEAEINQPLNNGGAIYIYSATITFEGNSTVTFYDNHASNGGAICIHSSKLIFEGNSKTLFNNTFADYKGGAIYISNSNIMCAGNSTTLFFNNEASNGGSIYIDSSNLIFEGNSKALFNNTLADYKGGAIYISLNSNIICAGNSTILFFNNEASHGGSIYIFYSAIGFEGNSTVTFSGVQALNKGGAIYIQSNSVIICTENSTVSFYNNEAASNGGAIYTGNYSTIILEGNSIVVFNDNEAYSGADIYIDDHSTFTFQGNPMVTFYNNKATKGGAIYINFYSNITVEGNSRVNFNNNEASSNGGVIYIDYFSTIKCKGDSSLTFYNNTADINGGAFYIDHNSTTNFKENSTVTFNDNKAYLGGSVYMESSYIIIEGNCFINFSNNSAYRDGGAIYFSDNSNFILFNNSNVTFDYNTAGDYGGAIYAYFKNSSLNFNSSNIYFIDNTAGTIHKAIYIKVPKSCDSNCLFHHFDITSEKNFPVATSPNRLILYNPVKCINGNDTFCDLYYMNDIMLGQEITYDACVLDYYNQPIEITQFLIAGMNHPDYNISSSKYVSISCNYTTQGIYVIGDLHLNKSYNYSINFSLFAARISDSKIISVTLLVELSPCHPGFWQNPKSKTCECYNANDIVFCSGSNSTIKRGYWFGIVTGNPTVTFCPINYCDFTCCESSNGYYHLSPVRNNQCRSHRSGTACGNCENGYTLSFDSPECVEESKCTIGQTLLVTTLSLLYWTVVVVAVFVMTYFKVTVGSLYAIVYYYSVVDILLNQNLMLLTSNELYTTVSIISNLAKLTPQFLGQLCLMKNMSGIDQQFIHYVHPTVVLLILFIISMLARRSRRVSAFVSRGIIHFICFLLLLSYTSIATTSLLLMRPLVFMPDVNEIHTYLSPDIKYFHGRHIAYGIVAILFIIVIVIGLPLLLLLEPFLNSKINFVKIKPLLDQFQCCYKDKYRCFSGYYMICRLVIISLFIIKNSDEFITQYLLISACALIELIHLLVRPYASRFLNIFDGIILQLIVIVSVLPIVEFADNNETVVLVITYFIVIMPLAGFTTIKLWFNRKSIQNSIKYLRTKVSRKNIQNGIKHLKAKIKGYSAVPTEEPDEMNEIADIVVDDNSRRNATIVDVRNDQSEEHLPDIMWCREPFMEELSEIEALNDIRN